MTGNTELSADQCCDALNAAKWRDRVDWKAWRPSADPLVVKISSNGDTCINTPISQRVVLLDVTDAQAIVSYIELTKSGSWRWAFEQMKAGNAVRLGGEETDSAIVIDRIATERGQPDIYFRTWRNGPQLAFGFVSSTAFDRTDWEIVEEPR